MSAKKAVEEHTNAKIIAADNEAKADLSKGADVMVPKGDESAPSSADPFAARKALFAKSGESRNKRLQAESDNDEGVRDSVEAMRLEVEGRTSESELDRGSQTDTNTGRVAAKKVVDEGIDNLPERVTVKVLGQEMTVPRDDVLEAGGVKAYQMERAASMRLQTAARREKEVSEREARLEQERKEFQQRESAGRNAPASASNANGAAPIQTDGVGNGEDIEALVRDLYSGDESQAKNAITEIIRRADRQQKTLDPQEIAIQAAALMKSQDAAPAKVAEPADPGLAVQIQELNDMMSERFSEVLGNPELKRKALNRFEELRKDPDNQYRRLTDLGREAAKAVLAEGGHPRQDVVDRKRTLPLNPSGSATAPRDAEQAPMTRSSAIEAMRAARGQQ